jgi:RNA polymerase sigma-70 factor (ECF subfamily)
MGRALVKESHDDTGQEAASADAVAQDEDSRLMLRIAARDERAFATLVSAHHGRVYALCRRMIGDDAEAEDTAQEVFLKLWTQPTSWSPEGARFSTWLYRVTANASIDRLRKRVPEPVDTIPDHADDRPGPAAALHSSQVAARVEAALARLPDRQRLALVLTYYQGLSNKEAATALEVNVDALESLLARARRSLKDELADEWRDLIEAEGQ